MVKLARNAAVCSSSNSMNGVSSHLGEAAGEGGGCRVELVLVICGVATSFPG